MKAEPESYDRIRAALADPGEGSSDFDLNGRQGILPPDQLRPAGVLVPLVERGGEIHVVLTKRTSHLTHHPGQIAFPGGKVDPGDADETAAAIREAIALCKSGKPVLIDARVAPEYAKAMSDGMTETGG